MYFSEIVIENYKSFHKPVSLKLEKGINIIVGQNNAGKTAVLEALSLRYDHHPHKSLETLRNLRRDSSSPSSVTVTFNLSRIELIDFLLERRGERDHFRFPIADPSITDSFIADSVKTDLLSLMMQTEVDKYFSHDNFTFRLEKRHTGGDYDNWQVPNIPYIYPPLLEYKNDDRNTYFLEFDLNPREEFSFFQVRPQNNQDNGRNRQDFVRILGGALRQNIYRFDARLIPAEKSELITTTTLKSDASNLAAVIKSLNTTQLKDLESLVGEVLPSIKQIHVKHVEENSNIGRVVVWTESKALKNNDLSIKLSECGSGVGQVIAILSIIMTEVPKVILIDEPQSFLHPGAARKLIEIIRDRAPQHQVIISTHSPTIISAASPKTIALVKQNGPESIIEKIDIDKVESQITCFRELGVSFSDIFGYDRVLWVEGRTEEKCFPLIIKYFLKTSRLGTAIIGVEHTGDFDQKNKQKIESIINTYKRLTETESGLTPPTVDFIFDRENRKTNKIADLKKIGQAIQGRECIYFIKRRIFENYLLNAEAIFDVISELDTERANSLTLYEIKNWIKQNKNNSDYYDRDFPFSEESWTNNIDGAKFLADMFSKNTNSRICYDKTNHSVKLIAKILEISPNDLSELTEMLKNIFNTES